MTLFIIIAAFLFGMFWNAWRYEQEALLWLPASPPTHQPARQGTQYYSRDGEHLLVTRATQWSAISDWRPLDEFPEALTEAIQWLLLPGGKSETPAPRINHAWQLLYDVVWQDLPPATGISGYLARELILPPTLRPQETDRALEWALANQLRRQYSPDELLEWYLNRLPFDEFISGAEAASLAYFGAILSEISATQAIQLAWEAVSQSHPVLLSEFPALAQALTERGQISDEAAQQLIAAGPLNRMITQPILNSPYADFIAFAHEQAITILQNYGFDANDALATGLNIITTLDWHQQQELEHSLSEILSETESTGLHSSALVVLDVEEGSITSMAGAAGQADASPAPVILPFLYLEGLRGQSNTPLHAASMLLDLPRTYPHPEIIGLEINARNSDDEFFGPILLAEALKTLRAVPIYEAIGGNLGLANAIETAGRLGWSSLVDETPSPSLLTHGGAVSVLDSAYAYAILANQGIMQGMPAVMSQSRERPHDPTTILEILDTNGNRIWRYERDEARYQTAILDAKLAALINALLRSDAGWVQLQGASGHSVTDQSGFWHLAYSPQHVFALHLKRDADDPLPLTITELDNLNQRLSSVSERTRPPKTWPANEHLIEHTVCVRSGGLANGLCEEIVLPFLPEIAPSQIDTHWQRIAINRFNGLLASEVTPAELIEEKVVFVPPVSAQGWWASEGYETMPTTVDTVTTAASRLILKPLSSPTQRGRIPIEGWLDPRGLIELEIAYGAGPYPSKWEILENDPQLYIEQDRGALPGTLAVWDSSNLNGDFTIRARASFQDNLEETDTIRALIDNQPPLFSFTTVMEGDSALIQIHNAENDIIRVEYASDSLPMGIQTSPPFGFTLSRSSWSGGNLQAKAYDAAGNFAERTIALDR